MLKAVSLAVDLIIANFNSRQDPEEMVLSGVQKTKKQKKNEYGKWGKIHWIEVSFNYFTYGF